jgi:hypothetical protein
MSAIADIDAIAKTNTATAARRRNHCFIADPLIVVNPDFAYRAVLSMTTATLPAQAFGTQPMSARVEFRWKPEFHSVGCGVAVKCERARQVSSGKLHACRRR